MIYTVESVLQGHPDKICDQISDAILDAYIQNDNTARTAIECMGCGTNLIVAGEVHKLGLVDIEEVVKEVYSSIGYVNNLKITNLLRPQSSQLNAAVISGSAGDQGVVYGYAIDNDYNMLPYGSYISNLIAKEIDSYRKQVDYLLPDGKLQVTVLDDVIKQLVISVQHKESAAVDFVKSDIINNVLSKILDCSELNIQINKNSHFHNGGFLNDTGLTGRKLMIDTYGGCVLHGGGAFSGKDPSKIDRSAAYMARYIAKNVVANGLEKECTISLAYVFGEDRPIMVTVKTANDKTSTKLSEFIQSKFDLRPEAIIEQLDLRHALYLPTSIYGHFTNPLYNWERIISI